MILKTPPVVYTDMSDGEIDLRQILSVLWQGKFWVVVVTLCFACAGIAYALMAPQVWSAHGTIIKPKQEDLLSMYKVERQSSLLGLRGFPSGDALFNEFILEFNSYENRREYLSKTDFFKTSTDKSKLDDRSQRIWLRNWASFIKAAPVDKKGEEPGIEINFSADTAEDSLKLLNGYIEFCIGIQKTRLIQQIIQNRDVDLSVITSKYNLMKSDASLALQRDITNTKLSLTLAKAAGVTAPLENYSNGDRFPITLGAKGLEEKLKLLEAMPLDVYQPKLVDLEVQMERLKTASLEGLSFRPFSYLDSPDEPTSRDKPKRPLVVVLATLLGLMLGVGIVLLQHALSSKRESE